MGCAMKVRGWHMNHETEESSNMSNQSLPVVVGHSKEGKEIGFDLATLPHLLIGGRTGSGKTVCMKSIIASLIRTKTPDEVRFILYDEKCAEYLPLGDCRYWLKPVVTSPEAFVSELENLEKTIKNAWPTGGSKGALASLW